MNGCLLEEVPVAIDLWALSQASKRNVLFFLSHLHADHTNGLTSSWRYPIYTSPINCRLAKAKFKFTEIVLKELELNVPHELQCPNGSFINVTLIDANHVPGSVMFLFQGSFGNILYSADMRYKEDIKYHPIIKNVISRSTIDVLYLDNTFCHPRFSFPSREVVIEEVLQLIRKHSNHYIKIGVRQIGKEDVLEAISIDASELILVYPKRNEQMRLLERPDIYTTETFSSRIHAIDLYRVNNCYIEKANKVGPTIGIMLTAMYYNCPNTDLSRFSDNIFILPYSDHSSYPELIQLVKELRPRKVKPIVKNAHLKSSVKFPPINDMSVFNEFLSSPRNSPMKWLRTRNNSISPKINTDMFTYRKKPSKYLPTSSFQNVVEYCGNSITEDKLTEKSSNDSDHISPVCKINKKPDRVIERSNLSKSNSESDADVGNCATSANYEDNTLNTRKKVYIEDEEYANSNDNFQLGNQHCRNKKIKNYTDNNIDIRFNEVEELDSDNNYGIQKSLPKRHQLSPCANTGDLKRQRTALRTELNCLDMSSRLELIREANDICSQLLRIPFELIDSQDQKRERMLDILGHLCQ